MTEQINGSRSTKRSWRTVALLLIGAGLLILIISSELFDNAAWNVLWPLAFIGLGLDLVTEGRQRRKVITGTLLAALIFVPLISMSQLMSDDHVEIEQTQESVPVAVGNDIDRVRANVSLTAGHLTIRDLNRSSDEAVDLEGGTITSFSRQGRIGNFTIGTEGWSERDLNLRFRRDLPLDLTVDISAGEAAPLDFEELRLEQLNLSIDAGNAEIKLPEEGVYEATITSNYATISVEAPHELPTRVEIDASMSDVIVDSRFEKDGNVYLSEGYSADEDHAVIRITSNGGNVVVR